MTPNEIITAGISGLALIVAGLALIYSRRSAEAAQKSADVAHRANDLMARQLELTTEEQKRQAQKELMENRPLFAWDNGPCDGHYKSFTFVNQGGTMSNATVTNDAGLQSVISPKSVIASNQPGAVTFHWANQERPKNFNFVVEFDDKLNVRQKVGFTVSSHPNGNLNLPEPAASNKN